MHLQSLFTQTKKMGRQSNCERQKQEKHWLSSSLFSERKHFFQSLCLCPYCQALKNTWEQPLLKWLWGLLGCCSLILIYQKRKRKKKNRMKRDYPNTWSPETRVQGDLFVCDQTKFVLIWSTTTTYPNIVFIKIVFILLLSLGTTTISCIFLQNLRENKKLQSSG